MIYAYKVVKTFATQFQIIKSIKLLPLNALFYYKFREHSHLFWIKNIITINKKHEKRIKTIQWVLRLIKTKTTFQGLNVAD